MTFMPPTEADRARVDESRAMLGLATAFSQYTGNWWVYTTTKSGPKLPTQNKSEMPVELYVVDNEQVGQGTTAAQTSVPTSRYQFISPGNQLIPISSRIENVDDPAIQFSVKTSGYNGVIRQGDLEVAR